MKRLPVLLPLLLLLVAAGGPARADTWATITSGWRPNRILEASGYLWASSEGGLLKLDPATGDLQILNTDDGLYSNFLTVVARDPESGYLWIGHRNAGLDVFDPASARIVQRIRDFDNDSDVQTINDIFAGGGSVFVASDQGLSRMERYENEDLWVVQETYRAFGGWSAPNEITRIAVHDGLVFAGGAKGIAVTPLGEIDVNSWTNYDIAAEFGIDPNAGSTVRFLEIPRDTLYAGFSGEGMYRWDGGGFTRFTSITGAYDLTEDDQGTMFAGRFSGLYAKGPDQSEFARVDDEYTAKFFAVTMHDGEVWATIDTDTRYFGGFAVWDDVSFEMFRPNTPAGDQILTLASAPNGDIWLAQRGSRITGVHRLADGLWTHYAKANQPHAPFVYGIAINAIEFDPHGGAWVGTWGNSAYYIRQGENGADSLFYFNADNSPLAGVDSPESNFIVVNGFEPDPGGGLWMSNMAAYDEKTLVYLPQRWFIEGPDNWEMNDWVRFGPVEGMQSSDASLIEIDGRGRLWITSIRQEADYPLIVMDPNDTPENPDDDEYTYFTADDVDYVNVNDMELAGDGALWIATPVGLYYVDTTLPADEVVFTKLTGALGQSINAVAVDPLNQVWVGTDFGLSVLGRDRFTWIAQYTTESGPHPSPLVDNRVTALAVRPETGEVFIGTNAGLSVVTTPYREFADNVGEIVVAPQPFLIGADPGARLRFSSTSLVADATIRLYSPSGRLVRTLPFRVASAEGWDGRDDDGDWVGSGVYYIVVTGPNGSSKTGKVAVVRE